MASSLNRPPRGPVRVVVATTALLSFISSWRASGLALAELGGLAFFVSGVADQTLGDAGAWCVLGVVIVGCALRAVDLESCALFVRGGLTGAVREAYGPGAARLAAAAQLIDHLCLGALAALVAGRYLAALGLPFLTSAVRREIAAGDASTVVAIALIGGAWWWQRQGRSPSAASVTRAVVASVVMIGTVVLASLATAVLHGGHLPRVAALPRLIPSPSWAATPIAWLTGLGYCLCALGSVEALVHVAPELRQPRIRQLKQTALLVCLYSIATTAAAAFLAVAIVPADVRQLWFETPLAALALNVGAPAAIRWLLLVASTAAAGLLLATTVFRSAAGVQGLLLRLCDEGVLPARLRALHSRFGTPWHLVDLAAIAQIAIVLATGGQVAWLARVYAVGLVWSALTKTGALVRLRSLRPAPRAFRVPFNPRAAGREWPIGLWLTGLALGVPAMLVLATGDPATLGGTSLLAVLVVAFTMRERAAAAELAIEPDGPALDRFQVLASDDVGLGQVETRPGNLLVPVRKPHFLDHLNAALSSANNQDVVAMTVRLIGVDVPDDPGQAPEATDEEQRLFSEVVAMAERQGKPVRLLIVPATNVFDAVVGTALRLQSAEIHVGESETLSVDDQARLMGEAWERAGAAQTLDTRLVVHHRSGRATAYHLGVHAPTLGSDDLRLIHTLWLDLVKSVGPHLHHHDVVRAALKYMEEQLNGPHRDEAVAMVRHVVRPAEELAAVVHARDFARLRDMVRNRPASDLADMLKALGLEDQVLVFRTLPRKTAAETFEYLEQPDQEALLKAMAQEDVAGLLNNMAPDDRTGFLEELPAGVTRQLLALLTPTERSIALTLLGYPEGSIGRLMTPDYIAVREHWTVQEVLDYVRQHGQDSETLNVIYVVDDQNVLIDDIRIREFLLTSPSSRVSDLMDRRFTALKAADPQEVAVAMFRRDNRSAFPVTDSAGVLIGIVTVDDVMDIAEAVATKEIQRVGGSEALDEPYMTIGFASMIQKRAGWLTALFLGEMLTATAMSFFEKEIARAVVLALFVPLIISSGGNSGSQASTLVIRAIALGEVQLRDWWRVMRREILAGLSLGSILGVIGFTRIALWSRFTPIYGEHWLLVAITVGMALIGVVLWGTLIGSLLPFLLRRLGFDPATSSAPFVATLVDVTGLVIYFSVALVILRGTLL